MKVQVRLFAVAQQLAGRPEIELELAPPATVGDLRAALLAQVPALADLGPQLMIAVDAEYADDRQTVGENAEVACIPPVSGG